MNRLPLKDAIHELTECEPLPRERIARLCNLRDTPSPARRHWLKLAVIALPVALAGTWSFDHYQQRRIHQAVAEEIAYNHVTAKPLDIHGDDPEALDQAFAGIGLQLVNTVAAFPAHGRLLGARHCSIQSVPAAQLRYALPDGRYTTVYQAVYDAERHGRLPADPAKALHLEARGIDITLWRDHGVIIAISRAP